CGRRAQHPTAGRAMTLGPHQTSIGRTQVHITPRWIIEGLGPFDLDPAAADPRPRGCAAVNYTERDDGLRRPSLGRPFLTPPFDRSVVPLWIRKLARHGCCTMPAPRPIGSSRSGRAPRLSFYRPDGTRQPANSGAPAATTSTRQRNEERY